MDGRSFGADLEGEVRGKSTRKCKSVAKKPRLEENVYENGNNDCQDDDHQEDDTNLFLLLGTKSGWLRLVGLFQWLPNKFRVRERGRKKEKREKQYKINSTFRDLV